MRIVITSGMVNSDRFSSGIRDTLGPALEKVMRLQIPGSFLPWPAPASHSPDVGPKPHSAQARQSHASLPQRAGWLLSSPTEHQLGLQHRLDTHLHHHNAGGAQVGDTESFAEFEGMMRQAPFRKGLELGFTSTPEGGLAARVDNQEVTGVSEGEHDGHPEALGAGCMLQGRWQHGTRLQDWV